jgi:hypothetical protein
LTIDVSEDNLRAPQVLTTINNRRTRQVDDDLVLPSLSIDRPHVATELGCRFH